MVKCIQEAEQFTKLVDMQKQIAIFYDPKTTEYCTNEQDPLNDSISNGSKDKHLYDSTYRKKFDDEISRRIDRK
jgi:hypothetical protein